MICDAGGGTVVSAQINHFLNTYLPYRPINFVGYRVLIIDVDLYHGRT